MKTFTNYAEKKAKQFLNLLQGYTKGIRITAILILLLIGVSEAHAWGWVKYESTSLTTIYPGDKVEIQMLLNGDANGASYKRFGYGTTNNQAGLTWSENYNWIQNVGSDNRWKFNFTPTSATTYYWSLWIGWGNSVGDNGRYYKNGDWNEGSGSYQSASVTVNAVPKVNAFTATAQSTSSIALSWTKNSLNDDVLIVQGSSTAPTQGTSYSNGSTIGTGKVVYKGNATSTTITGLSASTSYTFYIYSIHNSKYYSVSTSASATTNSAELTHDVTISYKCGTATIKDNTTTNDVGEVTSTTITAPDIYGYTFKSWELGSGINQKSVDGKSITITTKATGNYTLTAKYDEDLSTEWSLAHTINSFSTTSHKFTKKTGESAGKVAYVSLDLAANTHYEFKVYNGKWYGNNNSGEQYWIKSTSENWEFYDDAGNCHMKSSVAGTYTFKIDFSGSNPKISVYFPTAYTVTYSRVPETAADAPTTSPSVNSGNLVLSGTSMTFTAKDAKNGYTWKAWYNNNAGTGTALTTNKAYATTITDNTTIYAVYTANTYSVKFDANGGTGTMSNQNFTYGTAKNLTANAFTRTGYTFAGWNTKEDGSGTSYADKASVKNLSSTNDATVTLYAKWTPINYPITYNTNGGSGTMTPTSYTIETATFDLPTPTKDGCTFVGWYDNEGLTGKAITRIETGSYGNKTFYAKWDAEKFTLKWDANGGTITTPGSPEGGEVEAGTPLKAPTVTKDHYDHSGWSPEVPDFMPGEDVTYIAQWTPTEYTINYHLNGGSGTMTPTTYTIESETFELPNNPTKTGHTFAGWSANAELTGEDVTQIEKGSTGDKAYWAKWNVASYTINFDQQSGSDGTPSVTAQYGAKLSAITIPSRDGYLFDGYYTGTNGSGTKYYNADGTTTQTMPHNISKLYAKWIGYDHCIFFKNTLGWQEVYVYTFTNNAYWDDGTGVHPATNKLEQGKMTQVGKTDIYYYILTNEDFSYIAFSDFDMRTYGFFNDHKAVYRGDRYAQLQLFIPQKDQTPTGDTYTTNKYYNDGIWMKYNSMDSGYDWSGKTADSDWSDHSLLAEKKGDYSFTTTVSLTAGTNYEFKISNVGKDAKNDKIKETAWYGWSGTMTQANCTNKHFKHNTSNNAMITPTVDGDYTFTVYLGDGKVMVSLEYPLSKDDYRLAYDDITLSKIHEGHYLKKRTTGEILDTVSFFVRKDKTPQILLQQCTNIVDGKPTWATVNTYNITVNADGVYNFVLKQTNSGTHTATLETSATHKYTGDYYIRTDAAEGGWKSYRQASNRMNYSTYADLHSEFNHYFCSYREAGCNVKFIVANDYSECLTETMDNDDIIKPNQSSVGCLPANANIRFGWDSETNQLSRAYISGSAVAADRFLVLTGNEYLLDIAGKSIPVGTGDRTGLYANEEIFDDMGNWIYQVDVQACNLTTIRLSALYNGQEQLFKGAKNDISLLNSTEPTYYKVRMIYDFKTNHMISAWLLDEQGNTIQGTGSLASDILVIRKNQDQANQLTFIGEAERTDVGVVYGVMTFDKFFLNNIDQKGNAVAQKDEKTIFERALYWISFPFNVKLKDIFGFSNYGDHWILEKYNGQARAENGAWVDSESYWEYITDSEYELEAGKGYVLCLDLDKMGVNSDVFQHTDEVSLYFPSKEKVGTINGATTSITLQPYTCNIERDNRNIYDSNWHLIGVPRFADITTENINIIPQPTQKNVGFYYEYGSNGEYTVKKSGATTFQTMSAYLVQYAGVINWTSTGITVPAAIAARKNSPAEPEQVHLRLEIAQDDEMADQTFVQLQQEGATAEFDMNLDLTKMLHSGTNIYTLAGEQGIKSAGNVMPMSECVVPVGVKVDTDGEYTLRMPDGTEGMVVELIDYYTNTRTNLLLFDYTVDLSAGTCNDRFALHIQPSKSGVTTNIDQINGGSMHHEGVQKYLIDGQLYIVREGVVYDAQGHRL